MIGGFFCVFEQIEGFIERRAVVAISDEGSLESKDSREGFSACDDGGLTLDRRIRRQVTAWR